MFRRNAWLAIMLLFALASLTSLAHAQHGISWFAQYFNNHDFSLDQNKGHVGHWQQEGGLNFNWGSGAPPSPDGKIPADGFAVRFLADNVHFDEGNYRFIISADDYFVFFVDEQVRFDSRGTNPGISHNIDVSLSAGTHNLKVEYYEFSADAFISLDWSRLDGAAPAPGQPAPAAPTPFVYYAPKVAAQPAKADGSIVHVVQPGDTINAIAAAYNVPPEAIIERNQLESGGRWIYPGQEITIRDATTGDTDTVVLAPADDDEDDMDAAATAEPAATTEPAADDPGEPAEQPAAVLIDSDEPLRQVEIDEECLATLRGELPEFPPEDVAALTRFQALELPVSGVAPDGWEGDALGMLTRGNLIEDPSIIIHRVEPKMTLNDFVNEVLPQYEFPLDLPPLACLVQLNTTDFWAIYTFPNEDMPFIGEISRVLALMERDGTSMIALITRPEDFRALMETAFLPAIWNFHYGADG